MKVLSLPITHRVIFGLLLSAMTCYAWAHGPTRQKVTETIEINASAEEVWAIIGNFGDAHVWLPMVESTESAGGNTEGATRVLTLGPDVKIYETLKKHDDAKMSYSYKIPVDTHDVAILPVNNYSSTVSVKASDSGGSIVTWKGAFYRGYPNNDPPDDLNDEAAVAAVTGVYQAGLAHLKELAEK
jgi:carbon monoxide dehydrogenase subunit G